MLLRKLENVKIEFKSSISNIFQVKPWLWLLGNPTASQAGTNSPPTLDHLSPAVGRGAAIGPCLRSLTAHWPENLSLRSRWLSPSLAVPPLAGAFSGHPTSPSHPTSPVLRLCPRPFPRPPSREGKPRRVAASPFLPIGRKRAEGRALPSGSEGRDWLPPPPSRPPCRLPALRESGGSVAIKLLRAGGTVHCPRWVLLSASRVRSRRGECPARGGTAGGRGAAAGGVCGEEAVSLTRPEGTALRSG